MSGVQFNSNSIRMNQLGALGRLLQSDGNHQLRRTENGGVEVYKSGILDKIKSGFRALIGKGPTPSEKQKLGETMLHSAIARTHNHQIADRVLSELKEDLTDGDSFLAKKMIDRAKTLARSARQRQAQTTATAKPPSQTIKRMSPKTTAVKSKATSSSQPATGAGKSVRQQGVVKKFIDLRDQVADVKKSLDDFFIDMNQRREAIEKRKRTRAKKTRPRSASVSVTDAATIKAQIRANNERQGRLYLERIDKNGFFGTLLKNARNPNVADLLGDRTGFQAENALYPPPVTRSGADRAIIKAFRNYEPPADDPTKGMSQLTDVDKDQIAIAALKKYLALPPDPKS